MKDQQEELFEELLTLQASADAIPLTHHVSATSRRRYHGIVTDADGGGGGVDRREMVPSENEAIRSLEGVLFEEHLGLRFYLEDPLPMLRQACNKPGDVMFMDHEFAIHDGASVTIEVDRKQPDVKCVPGIISSSNCNDFRKDRKRIRRIRHFVNKARLTDGEWVWIRGSSMKNKKLFSASSKSVDPRNILQGKVGNCGFCSGFSSVAADWPDVLIDAFGEHSASCLSSIGAVSVKLFVEGNPRYLLMDDYLLCSRGSESWESPSMHSLINNDLWVRLLEKAYVKIQGTYASLDGHYKYNSFYRHPARAMQLLTGAPIALEVHYKDTDVDKVYNLLSKTQGGYARVAHCRKKINGLIPNHGYSLLWIGEGSGGMRIVCLRNPHGRGSHEGDKDTNERIKDELLATAILATEKHAFAECPETGRLIWRRHDIVNDHPAFQLNTPRSDNGIFFIPFELFVDCFPIVTLVGPVHHNGSTGATVETGHCVHKVKL